MSPDLISLQCATACGAVAAATDLHSRRIPNWLTGPGLLLGVALHFGYGGLRGAGMALLSALVAGGIFFVFFIAGGMGAGDVKLMAAVGALAGMRPLPGILIATALLGAVAAVVTAMANGRLRETVGNAGAILAHHQANGLTAHPELNVRNNATLRLPYAIPIAAGCAVMLFVALHGGPSL